MQSDPEAQQAEEWELLYQQVVATLAEFGIENPFGRGDYLIVDDNYGWQQQIVEVHRLQMLAPDVIYALKAVLRDHPGWEIIVAVDIPGTEGVWPPMGLKIHQHEIVDDLQREYLPKEYRAFRYEGSQPGTDRD